MQMEVTVRAARSRLSWPLPHQDTRSQHGNPGAKLPGPSQLLSSVLSATLFHVCPQPGQKAKTTQNVVPTQVHISRGPCLGITFPITACRCVSSRPSAALGTLPAVSACPPDWEPWKAGAAPSHGPARMGSARTGPLHVRGLHVPGLHTRGLHVRGLHTRGLHVPGLHTRGLHVRGLHTRGLHAWGLHIQGLAQGRPVSSQHCVFTRNAY